MNVRAIARPRAAAFSAATLVALALTILLLPQPAPAAGCGEVEKATSRKNVNPDGLEPFAFGDSVMHPAKFELADRGYNANSRGCRAFDDGVAMLRHLKRRDELPHMVVMALGTDGRVSAASIQDALNVMGPNRVLGLVTPREAGGGAKFDAVTMRKAARQNPRQVVLLDWVKHSRGHGNWFQPDGTHLTIPAGNRAFAAFLGKAIRFAPRGALFQRHRVPGARRCAKSRRPRWAATRQVLRPPRNDLRDARPRAPHRHPAPRRDRRLRRRR